MKVDLYNQHYVYRKKPINLSKIDEFLFQNALPGYSINASHLLKLKNVYIFFDVPYKSGVLFLSYAFLHPIKSIDVLKRMRLIFSFKVKIIQKAIWIIDSWSAGYFHWLTDALPRLIASEKYAKGYRVLLPKQYQNLHYVKESLDLLGYDIEYYDVKVKVKVEDFLLPNHTSETGNYNETILDKLRTNLLSNIKKKGGERKIYISRKRASFRFIKNEVEVIRKLEEFGFETHCFEEYTLVQQIEIMHETKFLISLHGAGLTNMLFMPKGGSVLEFRSQTDALNNCYFSLSSAVNLNYYYLLSHSDSQNVQFADFEINLDFLSQLVKQMIEKK